MKPASSLLTTIALLTLAPSAGAAPPDGRLVLANGLEVWVAPDPGDRLVAVHLDYGVGLRDERPGSFGLAASTLATLVRGATPNLQAGAADALAAEAGLTTTTTLDQDGVGVTMAGPPAALARALWITGERLAGVRVPEEGLAMVRSAIFFDAEHTRFSAVSDQGDPLDTVTAAALGPLPGHTPFASRRWALKHDADRLTALAARGQRIGKPRVVVSGSPEALADLEDLLAHHVGSVTLPEAAPRPRDPDEPSRNRTPSVRLEHHLDTRTLVTVAYDLRGVAELANLGRDRADAALLTLVELLEHPGGLLEQHLVDAYGSARDVEVRMMVDDAASLAVQVEIRSADARDAKAQLLQELTRLAEQPLDDRLVRSASRAAGQALHQRWARPTDRAALLGTLVRSGRISGGQRSDAWLRRVDEALAALGTKTLHELAQWGLREDRRVVGVFVPAEPAGVDRVDVNAELIARHVRILVDVRCPRDGVDMELTELVRRKYGMSAKQYVDEFRAIARDPAVHRQMMRDAEQRCGEYAKLRSMVPPDRALALHEAVACKAGGVANQARRDKTLARIFKRFDLDPSVYRPLMRMIREDVELAPKVEAIDTRCKPAYGPAAREQ